MGGTCKAPSRRNPRKPSTHPSILELSAHPIPGAFQRDHRWAAQAPNLVRACACTATHAVGPLAERHSHCRPLYLPKRTHPEATKPHSSAWGAAVRPGEGTGKSAMTCPRAPARVQLQPTARQTSIAVTMKRKGGAPKGGKGKKGGDRAQKKPKRVCADLQPCELCCCPQCC